ncbi:Equilibrative Nucleoside Transporter [Trichostrongylus colubriformis]|uniref:Equilibrative Nucleoside Transporter n=1 Tax=Trichostrongylus colubriformis TaxID=6319 RepID=A0AAN8F8B7_TRICO
MEGSYGSPQSSSTASSSSITLTVDRGYAVYWIFLLHGVGMLMSWNMFITIAPQYYVNYWFTVDGNATSYAESFMSVIGATSQIPNVGIMFVNIAVVIAGSLMYRIVVPLVINSILVIIIIALVIFVQPNDDDRHWFYIVTLIIIMLMNLCNGVYQNSIYGVVADFPDNYPNSLIIGNNLCGIFTSTMSIFTTLASPDNTMLNALLYFSISLGVLIVCLLSLILLSHLAYYQHVMAIAESVRKEKNAERPSLAQFFECFSYCWVQLFNNFFVYFVTLTIFPAMMTETPYYRQSGEWGSVFPGGIFSSQHTC